MHIGLRCFGEDGQITFDSSTETAIYMGTFSTGTSAGQHTDYRLSQGEPFIMPTILRNLGPEYTTPTFSISGTTIRWSYESIADQRYNYNKHTEMEIVYGVISR